MELTKFHLVLGTREGCVACPQDKLEQRELQRLELGSSGAGQNVYWASTVLHVGADMTFARMEGADWLTSKTAEVRWLCGSCPLCFRKCATVPSDVGPQVPVASPLL